MLKYKKQLLGMRDNLIIDITRYEVTLKLKEYPTNTEKAKDRCSLAHHKTICQGVETLIDLLDDLCKE